MRKRLWFFLTCLMLSASMAFAQKSVTGTVTDINTGEPLIGVHVIVNGQALGITDVNGRFTLNNVPESAKTIEFSYMGYEDAMSAVKSNIRIAMAPAVEKIDEVMVVAFGTQKKAAFTGSLRATRAARHHQRSQRTGRYSAWPPDAWRQRFGRSRRRLNPHPWYSIHVCRNRPPHHCRWSHLPCKP